MATTTSGRQSRCHAASHRRRRRRNGATTATPRAPPPPVAAASSTAPKPRRRRRRSLRGLDPPSSPRMQHVAHRGVKGPRQEIAVHASVACPSRSNRSPPSRAITYISGSATTSMRCAGDLGERWRVSIEARGPKSHALSSSSSSQYEIRDGGTQSEHAIWRGARGACAPSPRPPNRGSPSAPFAAQATPPSLPRSPRKTAICLLVGRLRLEVRAGHPRQPPELEVFEHEDAAVICLQLIDLLAEHAEP